MLARGLGGGIGAGWGLGGAGQSETDKPSQTTTVTESGTDETERLHRSSANGIFPIDVTAGVIYQEINEHLVLESHCWFAHRHCA